MPDKEPKHPEVRTSVVKKLFDGQITPAKPEELLEGDDLAEYLELKRKDAERMANVEKN